MRSTGFTLVEVVITAAVIALTGLAGLALSDYLLKNTQTNEHKINLATVTRLIQERLNDPTLCAQTLGAGSALANSISPTAGSVNTVQMRIPNLQAGPFMASDVLSNSVEIQPLKLKVLNLTLRQTQHVVGLTYLANLYLSAQDMSGNRFHETLVSAVTLNLDATNHIATCFANTLQDSEEICTGMGCTFNAAMSPSCSCALATPQPCPSGSYPVSYDSSGVPTCQTLGGSCSGTNYITGVHLGGANCASAPLPPTTCPSQPATWTVGGVTCTSLLPSTGLSSPATVSSASPAGTATFNCLSTGAWDLTPISPSCSGTCSAPPSFTWTVGADTCSAPGVPAAYGAPASVSDLVADPSTGSATFTCSMSGTWSGPTGATCSTPSGCPASSSTTGAGGVLPAPNGACHCNAYDQRWSVPLSMCKPAVCSCGGKVISGRTWIPCGMGGTFINSGSHMCDVTASESNFPFPPIACAIGNPTWSCAYFP